MALNKLKASVPENVLFQEVGDETVLLDIDNGEYYGLNQVASKVWSLLCQGHSAGEVFSELLDEYDIAEEQLYDDIKGFLFHLQSKKLIQLHEKDAS